MLHRHHGQGLCSCPLKKTGEGSRNIDTMCVDRPSLQDLVSIRGTFLVVTHSIHEPIGQSLVSSQPYSPRVTVQQVDSTSVETLYA